MDGWMVDKEWTVVDPTDPLPSQEPRRPLFCPLTSAQEMMVCQMWQAWGSTGFLSTWLDAPVSPTGSLQLTHSTSPASTQFLQAHLLPPPMLPPSSSLEGQEWPRACKSGELAGPENQAVSLCCLWVSAVRPCLTAALCSGPGRHVGLPRQGPGPAQSPLQHDADGSRARGLEAPLEVAADAAE